MGPVEYIVVGFPGNQFDGTVVPALKDLVDKGLINIIDLVFVTKDDEGNTLAYEFEDVPGDVASLADLPGEVGTILNDEDIQLAADDLEPNSSAALLVWEDVWATPFVEALRRSGGTLIAGDRVPADAVDALLADLKG